MIKSLKLSFLMLYVAIILIGLSFITSNINIFIIGFFLTIPSFIGIAYFSRNTNTK